MTEEFAQRLAALTPQQRRALAMQLRERGRATEAQPAGPVPLSHAQERLWFLDQLDPGDPVYNIPFAVRLAGPLNETALECALGAVVERHDALRTVFEDTDSGPRQAVREWARTALPTTDLRSCAQPRAQADRIAAELSLHRFDLTAESLLAVRLLRLADEEHLLLVVVHHIVFDGWSSEVFVTDLTRLYAQFAAGEPAGLAPLRRRLGQHAADERRELTDEVLERHLGYWRDQLAGVPELSTVPPDRPRPATPNHRAGRRRVVFPVELVRDLAALARDLGTTLNAVLIAATAAAVHQAGGSTDLLFGMAVAGRATVDLEPVVGCFANTLVVRIGLDRQDSAGDLIRRAHLSISSAYGHQAAPYARVVEAVAPARDRSRNPLFQIMVNVNEIAARGPRTAGGVVFSTEDIGSGHTDFDLFLNLQHLGDELAGTLDYSSDLYLEETLDGLLACLGDVLAQFAEQPERQLSQLPGLRRGTVALAASFTADPVRDPLGFWSGFLHEPIDLEAVPYGQLVQHLLSARPSDVTVVYLRWEDWLRHWTGDQPEEFLDAALSDLVQAVGAFRAASPAPLLLVLCPASARWERLTPVFARLDDLLMRRTRGVSGLEVAFAADWAASTAVGQVFDTAADELGHVPYTTEFFAALGCGTIRWLIPLLGKRWPQPGSQRDLYISDHLETAAAVAVRAAPRLRPVPAEWDRAVAPRTETERVLAAIWRAALDVDEIGVTDDFFAWGGHSLLATRLVSRIRSEFGQDLSLHTFLTHPTVEELARILDGGIRTGSGPGAVVPAPRGGEPVLSSTQRRAWALAQLTDAPDASNTVYAARLTGPLDEAALRGALAAIVGRHDVLRTSFGKRAGAPVPVLNDTVDPWLPTVDLRGREPAARERGVADLVARDTTEPYDLSGGPLLRARLIRDSGDVHVLVIGMHHAVCDISSWLIFLGELASFYGAAVAGRAAAPEPLRLQFADYAAWQRTWLASQAAARQAGYWRDRLAGAPPVLDLRGALPRPARRTGRAASALHALPPGLGRALRGLGQQEGVSQFTVLLAVLAASLRRESGQDDIVVGVPSRGRNQPELEGLIGYFADLLPLRVDLGGRPTFRQLLQRVHGITVEALAHQDIPLSTIIDALRSARSSSYHPLFQCVINYVDPQEPEPALPGLVTERLAVSQAATDFDLFLTVTWHGDELILDVAYATDILGDESIRRLLNAVEATAASCTEQPDAYLRPAGEGVSPVADQGVSVCMASSFPAGQAPAEAEDLARRLGVPLSIDCFPAGSVFRQLLNSHSRFGRAAAIPVVLFVRWEDLLGAGQRPDRSTLAATVWHAEEALADLVQAVAAFRERSQAPLLVVACPPSARWDALAPVFAGLDDRLSREASRIPSVEIVLAAERRVPGGSPPAPAAADPLAGLGRLVALRLLHGLGYSPRWVALDPGGWSAVDLGRLVAGQLHCGRRVVLAGSPQPGRRATGLDGAVYLGASLEQGLPELIAAGEVDPAGGLVLVTEATAADNLRSLLPGPAVAVIVTDQAPDGGLAARQTSWLLDPPLGARETRAWTDLADLSEPGTGGAAPGTDLERLLADTWADLLHISSVGLHDDFFALGGDSMLAIETAYRAVEAGLMVTPRMIVDNPTVSTLAAAVARQPEAGILDDGGQDEAPLTPAQHWFLDAVAPGTSRAGRFNHPYYLQLNGQVEPQAVQRALGELAARHDSLRLRLHRDGAGRWRQSCGPAGDGMAFQTADFSDLPADAREGAMAQLATAAQSSLSLDGPLVCGLHLRPGPDQGDRLLIVAHHLVTDGVSRGILFEELRRLLFGPPGDGSSRLPVTTPYLSWARHVHEYAQSARLRAQLPFWLEQRPPRQARIPMDLPGPFTFGTLVQTGFTLSGPETTGLLELARRLRLKVNDLLVWVVAGFIADWTGQRQCAVALTGHGREALGEGTDLSRTTGWFQVFYPLRLTLPEDHRDPASAADVARQLARVPDTGIGWSALRYLCEDAAVRKQLAKIPLPRVTFNYMGHFNFEQTPRGSDVFAVCRAPYGLEQEPDAVAPFDLDFVASMVGSQLHFDVNYSQNCHKRETVEWVLSEVRDRLLGAAVPVT